MPPSHQQTKKISHSKTLIWRSWTQWLSKRQSKRDWMKELLWGDFLKRLKVIGVVYHLNISRWPWKKTPVLWKRMNLILIKFPAPGECKRSMSTRNNCLTFLKLKLMKIFIEWALLASVLIWIESNLKITTDAIINSTLFLYIHNNYNTFKSMKYIIIIMLKLKPQNLL